MNRRPEAKLERAVLRRLGLRPELALFKNPVGKGYYGKILPILRDELERHPAALAIVERVLQCNRVTWGLDEGSPDLIGIAPGGRFLGFELKAPDGHVEPHQRQWHAIARSKGALVEVVRSVEEAEAVIDGERERLNASQQGRCTMGAGGERPQPRGEIRGERHQSSG